MDSTDGRGPSQLLPPSQTLAESLTELHKLALSRHEDAIDLPTIASEKGLSQGLANLVDALPNTGWGMEDTTRYLHDCVLPSLNPGQTGTRYFGFVTGGVLPIALLADWFVSLLDANVQVHLPKESLSTLIEAQTIRMLCQLLGLPTEAETKKSGDKTRTGWTGTVTTGATASNVLGLACGREHVLEEAMRKRGHGEHWSAAENGSDEGTAPVNVYIAQAHASVRKAAALAGIGRSKVVDLGCKPDAQSAQLDFDLTALEAALARSQELKQGAIVVVGMGEVNTGALTAQTPAIRDLCDRYGAWLHIDAAFSAFVCLLDGFTWISHHMDLADSITSDGHKQLNVPYDCGLFFVRKAQAQAQTQTAAAVAREDSILQDVLGPGRGSAAPSYLSSGSGTGDGASATSTSDEVARKQAYLANLPSPLFRNIENSRRFRALPLYLTLLCHGRAGIREIVERNVEFARAIEAWMRRADGGAQYYQVLTPSCPAPSACHAPSDEPRPWQGPWTTTVVLFAPSPSCPVEAFRDPSTGAARLIEALKNTRRIYVSPTTWAGRGAVRIAVSNWRTGLEGAKGTGHEGKVVSRVEDSEDYRVTIETLQHVMDGQTGK